MEEDKKSPPGAVKAGIIQGNRARKYSHFHRFLRLQMCKALSGEGKAVSI